LALAFYKQLFPIASILSFDEERLTRPLLPESKAVTSEPVTPF
jgi:hypothetical protein